MVSKKIRNLIIGIGLLYMLTFGNFIAKAAGLNGQYILPQSSITYVQKVDKVENVQCVKSVQTIGKTTITYSKNVVQNNGKKILIYHSHFCEKNKSMSVYDMGTLLTKDLEAKGYTVTNLSNDFSGTDYNNSYYASRDKLKTLDLSQYALIFDMHVDANTSQDTVKINNQDAAKIMWVQTKNNVNLKAETNITTGIDNELSKYGNISKGVSKMYFKGINYYNENMSPNINLIEMGNNCNTYDHVKVSTHYLASAIDTYLTNK
jgi:stage II sporulation protein P